MWKHLLSASRVGGLATIYFFATDPTALDPTSGAALLEHVGANFPRLYGAVIPDALLVALGTVALAAGCATRTKRGTSDARGPLFMLDTKPGSEIDSLAELTTLRRRHGNGEVQDLREDRLAVEARRWKR